MGLRLSVLASPPAPGGCFQLPGDHTKGLLMKQGLEIKLKQIMGDTECPKGFTCCTEGLENLCKAKDVGLKEHLECLEQNPSLCPFSVSFGILYLCNCALRVYITKKLGK